MDESSHNFRINQLTPTKIIGVGIPIDRSSMVEGTKNIKDQLKSDLIMLLLTDPGERIHLLDYGVGLKKLLFEQASPEAISDSLRDMINSQLQMYLPQISINRTETQHDPEIDPHLVSVKVEFRYLIDNSFDSIQLNFQNNN
jgi:phage baseplate assembly protein W